MQSLGEAKPPSFGAVLRSAIKSEFGTNKEFARALGVTEGRVSQIVSGPESVNPQTLSAILRTFHSLNLQEMVHEAWSEEFTPLPTDLTASDPDNVIREVSALKERTPMRALSLLSAARSAAEELSDWQSLAEQEVFLSLRLTKQSPAYALVQSMYGKALARGDRGAMLTALWMKGNVVRNIPGVALKSIATSHDEAVAFASTWSPRQSSEKERHTNIKNQLDRDLALDVLEAHNRRPVATEMLEKASAAVDRSIEAGQSESFRYMGLEVRSRVELAMGQVFKAEETLDEVEASGFSSGTDLKEKYLLGRARIAIARGERRRATKLLEETSESAFAVMNLHHHRVADTEHAHLQLALPR